MVCAETSKRRAKIFHHHPAEGAGDVKDFGLAMGKTGHDGNSGTALMVRPLLAAVNAQTAGA